MVKSTDPTIAPPEAPATRTSLDSEKHKAIKAESVGKSSHSNSIRRRRLSADGSTFDYDEDDDDDEFGGASVNEAADSTFLHSLQDEYEEENETLPTLLRLTESQLQAKLPMGLDKEKHDDIGSLWSDASQRGSAQRHTRNSGTSTNSSGSPRNKKKKENGSDSSGNDSDDGEFGDADEYDQASQQYLRRARDSMDVSKQPAIRKITPSQLQARLPAGLDNEKHEDIGDLLDSRHAMGIKPHNTTGMASSGGNRGTRDNDSNIEDDEDDEFGDANDDDVPVNKYLQDAEDEMLEEHKSSFGVLRVTPSQLQARIPAGLDNEKHEEISDLIDSRHEFDLLADDKDENNDDDEFGDADENDAPVRRFLHDSTHTIPFDPEELLNGHGDGNDPDGLSFRDARIRGIDGEKHEGISDFVAIHSHHTDNDDNMSREEFGKAGDTDKPVETYLDKWKDSFNDDEDFVEYEDLKGGPAMYQDFSNLDAEKHEDLGELTNKSQSSRVYSDDEDEFEQAGEHDGPVPRYLMSQSSFQGDDDLVSLEGQVAYGLDNETHDDLGGFYASLGGGPAADDDEDEFRSASTLDHPSSSFMKKQISIQDDEFLSPDEILQVEKDGITAK